MSKLPPISKAEALRYADYIRGFARTQESKSIMKQVLNVKIIVTICRTIRLIPAIRRHASAMNKKWPWTPLTGYYERPLSELRQEFGYQVIYPQLLLGVDD